MKLRYSLIAPLFASFSLFALAGCSSKSSAAMPSETAAPTQAQTQEQATTAAPAETESAAVSDIQLADLIQLMGKTDSEVVSVLGNGKEMKDEENTVVERIYTLPLLDEENTVTLSFNLYQYGSDLLEQATVLLGQEELQTYADAMAQMFGEAAEEYERSYFFTRRHHDTGRSLRRRRLYRNFRKFTVDKGLRQKHYRFAIPQNGKYD